MENFSFLLFLHFFIFFFNFFYFLFIFFQFKIFFKILQNTLIQGNGSCKYSFKADKFSQKCTVVMQIAIINFYSTNVCEPLWSPGLGPGPLPLFCPSTHPARLLDGPA